MHLCLVVMMADINYLSNKTLVKQSWEVCTKQGRIQSGSTAPSNTFRQSLGFLWTGLWGTGCASMDVARFLPWGPGIHFWAPWTHFRAPRSVWMWHLGMWFQGGDGGVGLMMGLDDIEGVCQPWWLWDLMILGFVWPFLAFIWPFPSAWVLTDGSWALVGHWGGTEPFSDIWKASNLAVLRQLHPLWEQ